MLKRPENITYQEVKFMIKSMPTEKLKVMLCLLYATGCRVSELLSLDKDNIKRIKDNKGRDILRIYSPVLKKRETAERFIPIHFDSEPFLAYPIYDYVEKEKKKKPRFLALPTNLFEYDRTTIWRWCTRYTTINPHGFRKIRATHLVTLFGYDSYRLKKFFNWSSLDSSAPYVGLKIEDIVPEMKKNA